MVAASLGDVFVMLCDWQGKCVWASTPHLPVEVGEVVWKYLAIESQEKAKSVLARVAILKESCEINIRDERGKLYYGRLWPLASPDVAICMLGARVPSDLIRLGARELECLRLLSAGMDARDVAEQLGLGVSTVHTHFKRAREKLGLSNMEALIAFAARYYHPPEPQRQLGE